MMPHDISVEITIGPYIIRPHPVSGGRTFIEVQRIDTESCYQEPMGPSHNIDLDELFKKDELWT